MELVQIRCAHCGRVLKSLDAEPASWRGTIECRRCSCDMPTPDRIVDVLMSKNLPAMGMTMVVPYSSLRPLFIKARKTGKTQRFNARVVD